MLDSRAEARTAKFDGEEGLAASCVIKLPSKDERKGGKLEVVEVVVGGDEMGGVASAEAIREFWEGVAMFEDAELDLGVIEGREEIKDIIDLPNAPIDDVLREANVADWPAE